ncbi:hypothetical protein ACU21_01545 [Actinobaculum suis]|uniref:hypothetical protein n=1 Tax=Actinobaculum suis TaxID=1657 RepID=UPI0008087106|nr:hypothetical protein [Actinobaculum suis]OCA93158.1 hypothetical protein ACU21_01545 [Actinobaculum suis]
MEEKIAGAAQRKEEEPEDLEALDGGDSSEFQGETIGDEVDDLVVLPEITPWWALDPNSTQYTENLADLERFVLEQWAPMARPSAQALPACWKQHRDMVATWGGFYDVVRQLAMPGTVAGEAERLWRYWWAVRGELERLGKETGCRASNHFPIRPLWYEQGPENT